MSIEIRDERDMDRPAVFAVNAAAFPTDAEARLADSLRASANPYISLVAVDNGNVIGHIMFTPVTLSDCDELRLMGLGPMAVAPPLQRQGIGTQLVDAGLRRCRDMKYGAVVVLGHPEYYPRFGFRSASAWTIECEYDVPEDAFMLLELSADYLKGRHGTIRYNAAFAGV